MRVIALVAMKTDRIPKCHRWHRPLGVDHLPGTLRGVRIAQNFPELAFRNTVSNDPSRRPSMSKTILITGASSGFGRDTAETLFRSGQTVYASMRNAQGKNREAAEALRKLGIKTVELDVSDDASVEAGVNKVLAEAGTIDVLVNNAGIMSAGVTEAFTETRAKG